MQHKISSRGSVGRVDASDTWKPWLQSHHVHFVICTIFSKHDNSRWMSVVLFQRRNARDFEMLFLREIFFFNLCELVFLLTQVWTMAPHFWMHCHCQRCPCFNLLHLQEDQSLLFGFGCQQDNPRLYVWFFCIIDSKRAAAEFLQQQMQMQHRFLCYYSFWLPGIEHLNVILKTSARVFYP